VLVATGEVPISKGSHLASVGVPKTQRGFIPVRRRHARAWPTARPVAHLGPWAMMNGRMMLAHHRPAAARALWRWERNILGHSRA